MFQLFVQIVGLQTNLCRNKEYPFMFMQIQCINTTHSIIDYFYNSLGKYCIIEFEPTTFIVIGHMLGQE